MNAGCYCRRLLPNTIVVQTRSCRAASHATANAKWADPGLVKYQATLIGTDSETPLRWFVVVALLLDPAAVLLLPVAMSARR
jgi:hypothetical protein